MKLRAPQLAWQLLTFVRHGGDAVGREQRTKRMQARVV
jgi:hypothetical protein